MSDINSLNPDDNVISSNMDIRGVKIEKPNESGGETVENADNSFGDDDDLRRMMANLRDSSPTLDQSTSGIAAIEVKQDEESVESEMSRRARSPVHIKITDRDSTDDYPAQNSPSYAAAKWAAKLNSGQKSAPVYSSSSTSSKSSWRDDFVAAVQANKRKRKAAADGGPKKKVKAAKGGKKKSAKDDDDSSTGRSTPKASPGRRTRVPTEGELEAFREPFKYGWKRELVYRKVQKQGCVADVYYITPLGVRLRSMPEVENYLRTASEKVTVDNFCFKRIIIGVEQYPGQEIIRGQLSPELARFEAYSQQSDSSATASPSVVARAKKRLRMDDESSTTSQQKESETSTLGHEEAHDDQSSTKSNEPGPSRKQSKPKSLSLVNLYKESLMTKGITVSPGSTETTIHSRASASSPKKRFIATSSASANLMKKLRKEAVTASQRQRNALLKAPPARSPAVEQPSNFTTRNKARKSFAPFRNGDAESPPTAAVQDDLETASLHDGSDKDRIQTCTASACSDIRTPDVACVSCLRLFHRGCLAVKGQALSTSQFECNECARFSTFGKEEEDEDDEAILGKRPRSAGFANEDTPFAGLRGRAASGSAASSLFNNLARNSLARRSQAETTISSGSFMDSPVNIGTWRQSNERQPGRSPPLDLAIDCEHIDEPKIEILINGRNELQIGVSGQGSPIPFPHERYSEYIKAVVRVFQYLPVRDLLRIRLVSKTWNLISRDPDVWKFARLRGCRIWHQEPWARAVEFMNSRGVEELDLTGCGQGQMSMRQFITAALPALSRFVTGYHYGHCLPVLLESTAKTCGERLRSLTMTLSKDPNSIVGWSSEWISSSCLNALTHCSRLVELRLSAYDPTGKHQRLYINGEGLSVLATLTQLKVLALFDVRSVDEKVFKFLDSLTSLRILEIGDCQSWTRETYMKLRRLTQLRRLRLEYMEPGMAGDALTEALSALHELREAELVKFSFDYSYASTVSAQPLLAIAALPRLHTLRLYPDLDGKWSAPTWRRTVDVLPHLAGLKRLELGIMLAEEASTSQMDISNTPRPPFMCTQPKQPHKIAYINRDSLQQWISEKLPNTVVNLVDCLSASELTATRVAKWW